LQRLLASAQQAVRYLYCESFEQTVLLCGPVLRVLLLTLRRWQDTVHRLSDDNVVEMVLKLIAQGKITLHKTTQGREWVTPKQIKYEVHSPQYAPNRSLSSQKQNEKRHSLTSCASNASTRRHLGGTTSRASVFVFNWDAHTTVRSSRRV